MPSPLQAPSAPPRCWPACPRLPPSSGPKPPSKACSTWTSSTCIRCSNCTHSCWSAPRQKRHNLPLTPNTPPPQPHGCLPAPMKMEKKHHIPITKRGAEKLKQELHHLKTVERPSVITAIAEARAQ